MSSEHERRAREFEARARAALADEMRNEPWDDGVFAADLARAIEVWHSEGWSDAKVEATLAPIRADAERRRQTGRRWSEADITDVLSGGRASVIWARGRERHSPGRTVTTVEHGAEPAANVERVVRRLTGRAGGRRSQRDERIEAIVEVVRNGAATRLEAAQTLGRVDPLGGDERSDYRRDVQWAGGWDEILRRAGRL